MNPMAVQQNMIHQLCSTADGHRIKGQYFAAEGLYLQALKLADEMFGSDHLETSVVCNNLAVLYKYMGRFDPAEQLYQRALAITEKALGANHTEVATIYHNLGGL